MMRGERVSCGFTYPDKCKCGKTKHGRISAIGTFATDSLPPRWIEIKAFKSIMLGE